MSRVLRSAWPDLPYRSLKPVASSLEVGAGGRGPGEVRKKNMIGMGFEPMPVKTSEF